MKLKQFICMLVASVLFFTAAPFVFAAAQDNSALITEITADMLDSEKSSGVSLEENFQKQGVKISEDATAVWNFSLPLENEVQIKIEYSLISGNSNASEAILSLDGNDGVSVGFERIFEDIFEEKTDYQGNMYRPVTQEIEKIHTKIASDVQKGKAIPYTEKLTAGEHTLSLKSISGDIFIHKIEILPYNADLLYYSGQDYKEAEKEIVIQAENALSKSDKAILVLNDRSSPNSYPYHHTKVMYNTIGGESWAKAGQWIEWEIDVPEDASYNIAFRYKQSYKNNDVVYRALTVDGLFPFEEAECIVFNSDSSFKTVTLDKKVNLKKGKHTIRLQAVLGSYEQVIDEMYALISELNRVYREIVMVTGPTPDTLRDYKFEIVLKDTIKDFAIISQRLKDLEKKMTELSGANSEASTTFKRIYLHLDKMVADPYSIASRMNDFKSTVTALGTYVTSCQSQPLELDSISFVKGKSKASEGDSFFDVFVHYLKQYIMSFFVDYQKIGMDSAETENEITVWTGTSIGATGRDQAQLISDITRNLFTPESQIAVNVQLVNAGSLLPATLAGKGPDIALGQAQAEPMNYALRGAVADLSQFKDIDEIKKRFSKSALIPFELDSSIYALPETQSFLMLFYREDVLEELGVDIKDLDTWEGLLEVVLPILQKSNLEIGIPTLINSYSMFLLQNEGEFYSENKTHSLLNEPEAIESFEDFTRLYIEYKLPITFDFFNRFRSGEMPISIQEFTAFNQLSVFAPEINGLWKMMPIPGTVDQNGEIQRSVCSTVTGCVIMEASKNKESAWEFMKWWTREDIQTEFSQRLETLLGSAARNATANIKAFDNLYWSKENKAAIELQRKYVTALPEIPGGYFTSRHFDFAFRSVVNDGKEEKESLYSAVKDIDREITNKRNEFAKRLKGKTGGES